jgi:hypothetical protein
LTIIVIIVIIFVSLLISKIAIRLISDKYSHPVGGNLCAVH